MKVERAHGYCFHRIDAAVKLSLACFSQSTEPTDDDIRYLVSGRGTQVSAGAPRGDGVTQPSCGQSRALTLTMSFVARYDVTPGAVSSSGRSKAAHTRALYLTEIS